MKYSEYHNVVRKQARESVSMVSESPTRISDILVLIVDKIVKYEGAFFDNLALAVRESADRIVNMFGISSNIKVLGVGSYGIALGIGDGTVLKITTDMDEFNSASMLVGKNLPNVMLVLKVAKKKDMDVAFIQYPEYTMLKDAGTKMSRLYAGDTEDTLKFFMQAVADAMMGEDDGFGKFEDSVKGEDEFSTMIEEIRSFLKSVPLFSNVVSSPKKRKALTLAFLRLGFDSFGDNGKDLLKMVMKDKDVREFFLQIITGVEALRQAGVTEFRDFHAGNITYQNGQYVLIDLGASLSYNSATGYQILEIARMNHGKHV
jgi:hypothetical protein